MVQRGLSLLVGFRSAKGYILCVFGYISLAKVFFSFLLSIYRGTYIYVLMEKLRLREIRAVLVAMCVFGSAALVLGYLM